MCIRMAFISAVLIVPFSLCSMLHLESSADGERVDLIVYVSTANFFFRTYLCVSHSHSRIHSPPFAPNDSYRMSSRFALIRFDRTTTLALGMYILCCIIRVTAGAVYRTFMRRLQRFQHRSRRPDRIPPPRHIIPSSVMCCVVDVSPPIE